MIESGAGTTRNVYQAGYHDGYQAALTEMNKLKEAIDELACEQATTSRLLERYFRSHYTDDGK